MKDEYIADYIIPAETTLESGTFRGVWNAFIFDEDLMMCYELLFWKLVALIGSDEDVGVEKSVSLILKDPPYQNRSPQHLDNS